MPVTNVFINRMNDLSIGRGSPFDPAKIYVGLSSSASAAGTSTMENTVINELSGNGYARQAVSYSADSVYDTGSDDRAEAARVSATFTASGGNIGPFSSVFIIMDGGDRTPQTFAPADINTSTDTITITGHGFADGDKIIISDGVGFGMPGGISFSAIYQAFNVTANTLQVSSDGLSAIDITSQGSGSFKVFDANGIVRLVETTQTVSSAASVTIPDGQTFTVNIDLYAKRTP